VRRTIEVDDGESFPYYGVALVSEAGVRREHAISTDIDEARFVFQVMTGLVPRSAEALAPAASPPRALEGADGG
jgi:hypothetical protein